MTAIDAAIIELKAHAEHTWSLIRALERYGTVVEQAHEPKAAEPPDQVKLPEPRRGRTRQALEAFEPGAAILSHLGSAPAPMASSELVRLTKLAKPKVKAILKQLIAQQRVRCAGRGRSTRYELTPRPGAVAGTQAAPPVGPPPASGPARPAAAGGRYEVAWNGRDRNAPLSSYQRKEGT